MKKLGSAINMRIVYLRNIPVSLFIICRGNEYLKNIVLVNTRIIDGSEIPLRLNFLADEKVNVMNILMLIIKKLNCF